MGKVIVLNGTSSVGKTSAARAFQKIAREHFLHVQMDAFMEMLPERIWQEPDGISFVQRDIEGSLEVEITTGPAFERVMEGMRQSIAALAAAGNNCIVDDVMLQRTDQRSYRDCICTGTLQFVGLHAPLETLEGREAARGDRMPGLARWQFERVHRGMQYDLEIEVGELSSEAVALSIAEGLGIEIL